MLDDDDFGPKFVPKQDTKKRPREDDEESGPPEPASLVRTNDHQEAESTAPTIETKQPTDDAPAPKKRKAVPLSTMLLDRLPSAQMYEFSYMHRDMVTHTLVTPETDFVITASQDGIIKFWKKTLLDVEFVKAFKVHSDAPVSSLSVSRDGKLLASSSIYDFTIKVFDVVNFDMVNVLKCDYAPRTCCFIHKKHNARALLAVSNGHMIHIYDPLETRSSSKLASNNSSSVLVDAEEQEESISSTKSTTTQKQLVGTNNDDNDGLKSKPLYTLDQIHKNPIIMMCYNEPYGVVVSVDNKGMIEYWMAQEPHFSPLPLTSSSDNNAHRDGNDNHHQRSLASLILFKSKLETDLYELVKCKTRIQSLEFSQDGTKFACMTTDRQVRVFDFARGKMIRKYDETCDTAANKLQKQQIYRLENIDFGRRMAVEKELDKDYEQGIQQEDELIAAQRQKQHQSSGDVPIPVFSGSAIPPPSNVIFDESGHFIIYPTMHGIKIVNIVANKVERLLGKVENTERFLGISIFQGVLKIKRSDLAKIAEKKSKTLSMATGGASNTNILSSVDSQLSASVTASSISALTTMGSTGSTRGASASGFMNIDPTIFACAYKKNRFYMFTMREPQDMETDDATVQGRDIFNEKPSKEDVDQHRIMTSSTGAIGKQKRRLGKECIIHTTMGDIHCKLHWDKCPKAVENFTVHSQEGYYNNHTFHRVIKNFMIQSGDPKGNGTGGASIWGREFLDEFHPSLRHNRPFQLSMANCGKNTNGSQFFITTVATPWLDDKHTLFGEVTKGQDVVQAIEKVKVKDNRPLQKISIVNIEITN